MITLLLDSDATVGTNTFTADAVDDYLRKIDAIDSLRYDSSLKLVIIVFITNLCTFDFTSDDVDYQL